MVSLSNLYNFSKWVIEGMADLTIAGTENVPAVGGCILATNHLSRFDTPILFVVTPRQDICALVADKYKYNPFFAVFVNVSDSVWINREIADFQAMRAAVAKIRAGRILGIAPEGTRSKIGELLEAKNGVALLAEKAGVPIIPVGITGTDTAMKEILSFKRPKISVTFGKPFVLPKVERGDHEATLTRNTDEIMCRIASMLPERYRGFYKNHPRTASLLAQNSD